MSQIYNYKLNKWKQNKYKNKNINKKYNSLKKWYNHMNIKNNF